MTVRADIALQQFVLPNPVERLAAATEPDVRCDKQSVGQITSVWQNLSRPHAKKFSLSFDGKSVAFRGRPASNEGRIMIVIYARRDAVDALASSRVFYMWTNSVEAYSEVVWS